MKTILLTILTSLVIGLNAQLNLQWQQLGPYNLGAPVQTMIIDNRDTTQQTLYAGVMGGGIWKSTNGGGWWTYLGCAGNYGVSCMAQAGNGTIYFGTGDFMGVNDGLSTDHAGNGLYQIDGGDNISHLDSTTSFKPSDTWFTVNRIAINPVNSNHLIVATDAGLWQSFNGGQNWSNIIVQGVTGSAIDVKWSTDSVVYAVAGMYKKLICSTDYGLTWNYIRAINNPGFPPTQGRIEVAIAPQNSSIAYVSVATTWGGTYGVFATFDRGNSWDTVALKSVSFNPFGKNNEGWADNAITVLPFDSSKLLIGGYAAYSLTSSGSVTWLPSLGNGSLSDSADLLIRGFVGSTRKPGPIYCYGHRGIYKCFNPQTAWPDLIFYGKDAGIKARDFNSLASKVNGEVWATSHYIGLIQYDPATQGFEKKVRYSSFCDVSVLSPNVVFVADWAGQLKTSLDGGQTYFYKQDLNLDPQNQGDPSRCGYMLNANTAYQAGFKLAETKSAYNSIDSVNYLVPSSVIAGDTLWITSNTAATLFPYITSNSLSAGQVIRVPDPVQSRLFFASICGIWMKLHALDTAGTNDWYRISNNYWGVATSFSTSADGDTLFAGTEIGRVVKLVGLNKFKGSANWNVVDSFAVSVDTLSNTYRNVQGIAVDPHNANNIVAVLAGYRTESSDSSIFISHDGAQTWNLVPLGVNNNPAYTCLFDAGNSNNIIVGTEHGVWTSTNGGANFQPDNSTMCDVPVYSLRQSPLLADQCPVLYAATNSMGIWRSFSLTPQGCDVSIGIKELKEVTAIHVFPNPASNQLQLQWNGEEEQALLSVYDVSGKLALSQKISRGTTTLNTSGLSSGFYSLTVVAGQQRSGARFIVSH